MRNICLYFQVHQPFRLRRYRFFDIGNNHYYYDDFANRTIMRQVADRCYLPMNSLLRDIFKKHGNKFKVTLSISGCALEQFEMFAPDVLDSFIETVKTGNVELAAETYAHSLCSIKNREEFFSQVKKHSEKIEQLFGIKPVTFRNTELLYSDKIGAMAGEMGYKIVLTEGAKHVLGWKSPNFMYCNSINEKVKVLCRNFRLSDDISFRFSNKAWDQFPLTAEKYFSWLKDVKAEQETVNIFMDYETFGEHQRKETGIFEFIRTLPDIILKDKQYKFSTPSELAQNLASVAAIHVPYPISWADEERDLTAWLGNDLQEDSFNSLYALSEIVNNINDPQIKRDWLYLQNSDHFYYMCTKWFSDGEVHKYFNPYESPYDAYINYMNVLSDFKIRINKHTGIKPEMLQPESAAKRLSLMNEKHENISADEEIKKSDKKIKEKKSKKVKKEKSEKKAAKKIKEKSEKKIKKEKKHKSDKKSKELKKQKKQVALQNEIKKQVPVKSKKTASKKNKTVSETKKVAVKKPAIKKREPVKNEKAKIKTVSKVTDKVPATTNTLSPKKVAVKKITEKKPTAENPKQKNQLITPKPKVMKKEEVKKVAKAPKAKVAKKAKPAAKKAKPAAKKAKPAAKKAVKKAAPKAKVAKKPAAKKAKPAAKKAAPKAKVAKKVVAKKAVAKKAAPKAKVVAKKK